ncbi:hypothetical protein GCM10007856_41820 [Azospirillum oryzae]|nr:hypothetical protein GCM10007856_41820 [Azospirillum oryzae]
MTVTSEPGAARPAITVAPSGAIRTTSKLGAAGFAGSGAAAAFAGVPVCVAVCVAGCAADCADAAGVPGAEARANVAGSSAGLPAGHKATAAAPPIRATPKAANNAFRFT